MCDKCVGGTDIIILVIVVLIIAALVAYQKESKEILVGLIAAIIGVLGYYYIAVNKEHLESLVPITSNMVQSDDVLNYNYDNNRYSEHGNITMARDIDSMQQRSIDLDLSSSDDIDNADTVETAIEKHSSNFQPDRAHGFSSTNSAYLSNYTLGEPNPAMAKLSYTVPLNDAAYDLDESLSRGQQYRASINKRSIDGAVRHTRNSYNRVFSNELKENEKRVWYSAEAEDLETDFRPYY